MIYTSAEKEAIFAYEEMMTKNASRMVAHIYHSDQPQSNGKIALAVIRYVMEEILHWTPELVHDSLTPEIIFGRLHLSQEWKQLVAARLIPDEIEACQDIGYLAALLYPQRFGPMYSLETRVTLMYRSVTENGKTRRFPKCYFNAENSRQKAEICLRYMLERYYSFDSVADMYRCFSQPGKIRPILKKYCLNAVCELLYSDALEFLHESLPDGQKSEFLYHYYKNKDEIRRLWDERFE